VEHEDGRLEEDAHVEARVVEIEEELGDVTLSSKESDGSSLRAKARFEGNQGWLYSVVGDKSQQSGPEWSRWKAERNKSDPGGDHGKLVVMCDGQCAMEGVHVAVRSGDGDHVFGHKEEVFLSSKYVTYVPPIPLPFCSESGDKGWLKDNQDWLKDVG
jgi:hypothetical protein